MHWKRWITALITVPFLVLIIFKGGSFAFTLLTMAVSTITLWEYLRIVNKGHEPQISAAFSIWAYICGAAMLAAAFYRSWPLIVAGMIFFLLGVAFLSILRFRTSADAPVVAVKYCFGILYIPLLLAFAVLIHGGQDGPLWTFFIVWVVAWGDTGAFYTGSYLGRHKLCPAVSPKKTIEGAAGGLAANLVFAWLYKILFFSAMPPLTCTVIALAAGASGQVGDLFESVFKRAAGVKDSGGLLPGHGGFLDRIDALLLATPVAYYLKEFLLP